MVGALLALVALAAGAPDDFKPLKAISYILLTVVGVVAGAGALLLMHVVVAVVAVFTYRKVMPLS